jgi:hypothetical protein
MSEKASLDRGFTVATSRAAKLVDFGSHTCGEGVLIIT